MTGSGGNGGESWRGAGAAFEMSFSGFDPASESLDESEESEEEGVIFLLSSESVALVSELGTTFFLLSSSESDSESEDSEEDPGSAVLRASSFVEEAESLPDSESEPEDESLADALPVLSRVLAFGVESDSESESESTPEVDEEGEDPLSEVVDLVLVFGASSSDEDPESEDKDDESLIDDRLDSTFAFLAFGA
jgi:hypothetical protein